MFGFLFLLKSEAALNKDSQENPLVTKDLNVVNCGIIDYNIY